MEIKKYMKNKDIEITNEDFDIEKLENDLRKGYELSSEVEKKVSSAVAEAEKNSKTAYDELQRKYDDIEKRNTDLADKVRTVSLERTMVEYGFKKDQFDEVSKMRSALYGEEQDDDKAISLIKEKYKDTYFPTPATEPPKAKDDLPLSNGTVDPPKPEVTRTTSIKDMVIKK